MDPHRFDHLARGLAEAGLTRRGLARLLTGAALATFLGEAAPATLAKRKKSKKKYEKTCKNGTVKCGNTCVNTQTNALHCGGCGRRCGSGIACVDGQCQGGGCPGDHILCGALCVDPEEDEQHCGGCNTPCPGGHHCRLGECVCPGSSIRCVEPGHACCGSACANLSVSNSNCGACGNQCPPGTDCCGGGCVDPVTDTANCSRCGIRCESGEICCFACRDPDSLQGDGNNCGACRVSCGDILPDAGHVGCCGGACVDLLEDRNNCGECDNVCRTGEECQPRCCGHPVAWCVQVAGGGDDE